MEPSVFFLPDWPPALSPLLWIALAVVSAALAGEWVRHHLGLPRITAYPLVGMLVAAIAGDRLVAEHNEWLNRGFDVVLAIFLFELGSRVDRSQLVVAGQSASGGEASISLKPIDLSIGSHAIVRGSQPLPAGFQPRQATVQVLDRAGGNALGMRVLLVK